MKKQPSSFIPADAFFEIASSSTIYVILPFLSYPEIVKMQQLNRKFYSNFIEIATSNLNEVGGVGLGCQSYRQYPNRIFMVIPDSKKCFTWSELNLWETPKIY